jgi:hypothetical protein
MVPLAMKNNGSDPVRDALARFPDSEGTIRELFEADWQFRELCIDYAECVATLRRLRRQAECRDDRIEQYSELRASLEQELLDMIAATTGD